MNRFEEIKDTIVTGGTVVVKTSNILCPYKVVSHIEDIYDDEAVDETTPILIRCDKEEMEVFLQELEIVK